jgi:predicted transcriptional regulator
MATMTGEAGCGPLASFARSHLANELVFQQTKLIKAEMTTPIDQVLEILHKANIRALPIYKKENQCKKYVGIISTSDIINFIVCTSSAKAGSGMGGSEGGQTLAKEEKLLKTPVGDLFSTDIGQLSPESSSLWTLEPHDTMLTVIDYFSKGIHRALIHQRSDRTGKMKIRMVTQTDALRLFFQNIDHLGPLFTTRIEELKLCNPTGPQRKIFSISPNNTALDGFMIMSRESIQSIPVVNEEGVVVTTLSTSDTKGLTTENLFQSLSMPVLDFLKQQHGGWLMHPITAKPRDTLKEVIGKMLTAKVHRHQVWVTDSAEHPIEVISMTDVLRKIHDCVVMKGQRKEEII